MRDFVNWFYSLSEKDSWKLEEYLPVVVSSVLLKEVNSLKSMK